MLTPVRTSGPATDKPILSTAEIKSFLRVDDTDNDSVIEMLRNAAVGQIDGPYLGRCLINQTWRVNFDAWPECEFRLPFAPVSAITSIKYWDSATPSVQQTVTSTDYALLEDAESPYVKFVSTYSGPDLADREDAIEVLFVAGYGADSTAIPAAIKAAVLLMIGNLYENREDVVIGQTAIPLPQGSRSLLGPYHRHFV